MAEARRANIGGRKKNTWQHGSVETRGNLRRMALNFSFSGKQYVAALLISCLLRKS